MTYHYLCVLSGGVSVFTARSYREPHHYCQTILIHAMIPFQTAPYDREIIANRPLLARAFG